MQLKINMLNLITVFKELNPLCLVMRSQVWQNANENSITVCVWLPCMVHAQTMCCLRFKSLLDYDFFCFQVHYNILKIVLCRFLVFKE